MSDEEPEVFKITIQQDAEVASGTPQFSMVTENFLLGNQPATRIPLPVVSSSLSSPVFAAGQYMKCAVPNCHNYFDGGRCEFMGISYFPFPQDPLLRKEWISAIDLPDDKNLDHLKVCSDHFLNRDFVSDLIEIQDDSEDIRKAQEIELKPDAKPTVKLGTASNSIEDSRDPGNTETNFQVNSDNFIGPGDPLVAASTVAKSAHGLSIPPTPPPQDATTPPETELPFGIDANNPLGKGKKDLDLERANTLGTLVDVVEVDDDSDDPQTTVNSSETNQGLINVPASVKHPPRKSYLTGDSGSTVHDPTLLETADISPEIEFPSSKRPAESPSPAPVKRRRRANREEMRRREEEDVWEPSIWSKRTWNKGRKQSRAQNNSKKIKKSEDFLSDEDSKLEDDDDGFVIDDPSVSTKAGGSPDKRHRPGPASKTSRPQYVPPSDQGDQSDSSLTSPSPQKRANDPSLDNVLSDKSLLIDWSFFKSLIPDLGKMSRQQRNELRTFILDTLNAKIYEGKPIPLSVTASN